ncbi:MAG: NADH:flavin oxidoreductase/NADH oxidase [Lysobacteraceae bacterium]
MSALFSSFQLKDARLRNRIAVPPMCQYQAIDGFVSDWHLPHYAGLARGGAGLVIVEATAVSPEGRISPACLGLWRDEQQTGLAQIAAAIKAAGAVPGIQIGHAGRKASAHRPWEGDNHIGEDDPAGWATISPSAIAFGGGLSRVPRAMTRDDIARVQGDFVAAAKRALAAGFEWLELHFAHGYLAQSFLSVHANQRDDAYGGSPEKRGRFLRECVAAVRKVWPESRPLTARLGVIEYDGRDEETLSEAITLVRHLRAEGLDLLNVSMGFSTPEANIPWAPALLAPVTQRVRRETELPVAASWGIDAPELAERMVAEEMMDLVMVGRAHLANPHWPYATALALGVTDAPWLLPASYAHWLARYRPAAGK